MKKVNVEDSVGMVLCHDITAIKDGFKGPLFKRGHVIEEQDIETLLDLGKRTIYIWEENSYEIHEEDAAKRMANLVKENNFHYTPISEGKTSAISEVNGMLKIDRETLKKINSIEDITYSTLIDHYPVQVGDRVASMRIVPLVTKEENIKKMEEIAKNKEIFKICPYEYKKVGIIITGSEIYHGRIKDKFEEVIRKKLLGYPTNILGVKIADDDKDMIVNFANEFIENGAKLIVFTGGMSVDPDDVTPIAVRNIADEVITQGVPAQPGNMTIVAYKDNIALIGVPGAAIHAPTTVFDCLLPQIFANIKFTRENLINLGDGGLCQNCIECRFPNCTYGKY